MSFESYRDQRGWVRTARLFLRPAKAALHREDMASH